MKKKKKKKKILLYMLQLSSNIPILTLGGQNIKLKSNRNKIKGKQKRGKIKEVENICFSRLMCDCKKRLKKGEGEKNRD
jgi:hypothetical protein